MIFSIDWTSLRPLEGSQQKAFEELCVQLAGGEPMPPGSRFVRKGAPDAGVECYWTLPNGDLHGWQAKFFRDTPKATQWQQIDESVERALSKHEKLVQYTVCLPIDRADPKDPTKQYFMDQWNVHDQKWRARAQDLGLLVEFLYWGQSEILTRLALNQHRGRSYFWFNKELFTHEWFAQKLQVAIANAGRRYHPNLNVPLPITNCFRGLGRTPEFFEELDRSKGELRRKLGDAMSPRVEEWCPSEASQLRAAAEPIVNELGESDLAQPSTIPLPSLGEKARSALKIAGSVDARLREVERTPEYQEKDPKSGTSVSDSVRSHLHYLYQLERRLGELIEFTQSPEALLANTPVLLLFGNAGVGKTHLFCDVAKSRERADQPTIVLLGEQFSREEPWSQILKLLGLTWSVEDFLGALNAAGELRRCRTLLFIDALNEGEGIHVWPKYLAGMLVEIRRYPWIGIAFSVRETYLEAIVPKAIDLDNDIVRVRHHGFAGLEALAVTRFFAHYKIATPGVPLMQPEFSNPLFLQLFCEGITNRGLTHVPAGLESLTAVFEFFLDSINEKLAGADYLNCDPKKRLVQRAVKGIAEKMAASDLHWLARDELDNYLLTLYAASGWEKSLLRHMLSEGILSQDFYWDQSGGKEGIRFSYERFTDHQIANFYLDKFLDLSDPAASFTPESPLGMKVKNESDSWQNGGLVSALAIQLPERIGKELPELAPHCARFRPVVEAMLESFVWRKHTAYSDATLNYVNDHLMKFRGTADDLLRTMISVSTQPDHPYNADCLHRNLLRRPMPDRDAWWSILIHHEYSEEQSPVTRLLDWAEAERIADAIADKSLRLLGITLGWCLTSSNRFLRDRATKALVALFTLRIPVFCDVLQLFRTVDDMYVLERLIACAYGCAMRSSNKDHLRQLANWCYDAFFGESPPPHILLRDYARGVIERAIHVGADLKVDRSRIEPPYGAKWPRNIPSEAKLKHLGDWKAEHPKLHPAQLSLYSSVMGFGDFARYIIGTNHSGSFDWKAIRLGRARPLTAKQIRERFLETLTSQQLMLWHRLEETRHKVFLQQIQLSTTSWDEQARQRKIFERPLSKASSLFTASLTPTQARIYRRAIRPKENGADWDDREHLFDLGLIQRFVLNRVFQLGWTAERFGDFDREVESRAGYSRGDHKAERIGKKYQWLAYHEALARVADNFVFHDWDKERKYQGPWQTWARDIDPSITIKKTQRPTYHSSAPSWWVPMQYGDWRRLLDDRKWLRELRDLPKIQQALIVLDPQDGSRWLTLQGFHEWEEPTPADREWSEVDHRSIWYHLRSYIVRKKDFASVFHWAKQQNFMGRWMPESHDTSRLFLGELFWSPAFRDQWDPERGELAWTVGYRGEPHKPPAPMIVTAQEYLWGSGGYDCSIEESIGLHFPSPWLAENLGLRCGKLEGTFIDATGNTIAHDPSVFTPGRSALLIRPKALRKLLDGLDCEIFWRVLGEKQFMRAHSDPYPARNELSGAIAIRSRKLEGRITSRFRDFLRKGTSQAKGDSAKLRPR